MQFAHRSLPLVKWLFGPMQPEFTSKHCRWGIKVVFSLTHRKVKDVAHKAVKIVMAVRLSLNKWRVLSRQMALGVLRTKSFVIMFQIEMEEAEAEWQKPELKN